MTATCIFCAPGTRRIVCSNELAIAVRDGFPVSPGHTLVIPRRHVGSFFDTTAEERTALFALLDAAKAGIDSEFRPDGYNIGVNDGPAGGQTIPHLHIHLIPRYGGDKPEPRGGVRWIIPDKADYWSKR